MISRPLSDDYADDADRELVARAQTGDRQALEELITRHQPWIYNIAVRVLYTTENAEDATQEILMRVVRGIHTFRGESKFRTWLYRLATNQILSFKRKWAAAEPAYSFDWFAGDLDATGLAEIPDPRTVPVPVEVLIEEAKMSCTAAMLLCLDGRQRLVYTLGEIFGVSDSVGAEVVGITPANFRQILARARRDLYTFLDGKCGLVNESNPCRCPKKVRGFMERGYLKPDKLQFATGHLHKVREVASSRGGELIDASDRLYAALYQDQPFVEPPGELVRQALAGVSLDPPN
ncbi:RNA polymerase sigma factor [uncultured Paludibaculum sp.]|uniref:RNA polymerase sigma factor n=1 Tax=uncultured Paludibaculum sp. TaxID=1765020 RepID=UPI002AAC17CD|nr:RNA polymerase sigma factor [uncultured Paludibaculum sp.]